ncbi:MAG: PQQ-binding-like beta-propeller repeat protein [Betaproteobacteria bacterium]|nr:PQQ-binding-like beta-propeller repeat protein [Betaproteobacteria bacterium]
MRDPASGHFIQASACHVDFQYGACVTKVNGSTGSTIWSQFIAWPNEGTLPALAVDASGNAFVGQRCEEAGGNGYCVARLQAATGVIQWTASLDEPDTNLGFANIAVEPSGHPVVAGTCHTGFKAEPCISKFDGSNGTTLWSRRLDWGDMSDLSRVRALATDGSGNVLVAGDCDLGFESLFGTSACIEKLASATGSTLWQAAVDPTAGDSPERFDDIALFSNGDVAAAGSCSNATCTFRIAGGTGAVLWQGLSTGVSNPAARVRVDATGHVVSIARCLGANVNNMCFERRDGSTGGLLWSTSYSAGTLDDSPSDLAVGSGGALFVAGYCSRDFLAHTSTMCTLRIDGSSGAVAWVGNYNAPAGTEAVGVSLVLDAAGNPVTFGHCSSGESRVLCAVKYLAASPTVQWSFSAGASHFASISEIGVFGRSGGFTYTAFGCGIFGASLCVMKTNETTGGTVWVSAFDGEGPLFSGVGSLVPLATGTDIAFSPAGDPIVAGTCSVDPFTNRICARKLSAATGAATWTSTYTSPGGGYADGRAVAVDAAGDAYVTGTCRNAAGDDDICTVRFAGDTGAVSWSRLRTGTQVAHDEGVAVSVSGSTVIATGRCANGGTGEDICTTAYAASTGTVLWQDAYDGPLGLADRPVALAFGAGAAYVSGQCSAGSQNNYCTLKYDLVTGARVWAAAFAPAGNSDDKPVAIAVGPDGNPVVTGTCFPNAGDVRFGDLCTVKHSATTGSTLWTNRYLTGFSNVARDLAVDAAGNVLVAGECSPDVSARVDLCLLKLVGTNGIQGGLYTLGAGGLGAASARRVITSGGAIFVAAEWTPRFDTTGVRILRFSNDIVGPSLSNVVLASPNNTSITSLSFDVTFSEPVTGVDAADFSLATSGEVAGATITSVTGGGATWTVTLNRGTGTGQIRLNVLDNDTIVDANFVPLNGAGNSPPVTSIVYFQVLDPVDITTTGLPNGTVGVPYSATFQVANAVPPVSWSFTSGGLPAGLVLDGETGAVTGTPTAAGTGNYVISVMDDFGRVDSAAHPMTVNPGTQLIAFAQPPNRVIGTGPFVLSATGGGSGLPVTFASLTASVCTATGTNGTTLTLLATGSCTIRASQGGNANWLAAPNVERTFLVTSAFLKLTVTKSGLGTVTSSSGGIACGISCSADFPAGTVVSLGQVAASGYAFSHWTGDCTGAFGCAVTMDAPRAVTAVFVQVTRALTVTRAGTGTGNVLSAPAGIDCGAACTANFNSGASVTLTATPTAGSTFAGWSGACTGAGTCIVTMDAAKSVTATFDLQAHALTVSNPQAQRGTIFSSPDGIACGVTCASNFAAGTVVTLTASPSPNFFFSGWSGSGCSGISPCQVTMDAAKSVSAEFKSNSTIPRLANISTRMQVLTDADVLIGGFIIGGTQPKTVVVRARGPSLTTAGVPGALANPVLQLFSGPTPVDANDNWQQAANAATIQSSGFAPSDPLESAIYTTLNPGAYTAIVTGANLATGVAIIEVFEISSPEVPLLNIATRGKVLTDADVMIGGFIVQGDAPLTVVVRARGPSLTAAGVPGALQDTVLQLFSGPIVIASNDDWQASPDAALIQSSGFAPGDTRESVIRITLSPGAYTAIVTGKNGATGVGIIEVFAQ